MTSLQVGCFLVEQRKERENVVEMFFDLNVFLSLSNRSTFTVCRCFQDSSASASASVSAKQQYDLEQEKQLPGVVMAKGGQVFDMLYRLSDLDESKYVISACVQTLSVRCQA